MQSVPIRGRRVIEIASIPTENYDEVIEIRVPVRFYWKDGECDGIEAGPFTEQLQEWQEVMFQKCLTAIAERMSGD